MPTRFFVLFYGDLMSCVRDATVMLVVHRPSSFGLGRGEAESTIQILLSVQIPIDGCFTTDKCTQ